MSKYPPLQDPWLEPFKDEGSTGPLDDFKPENPVAIPPGKNLDYLAILKRQADLKRAKQPDRYGHRYRGQQKDLKLHAEYAKAWRNIDKEMRACADLDLEMALYYPTPEAWEKACYKPDMPLSQKAGFAAFLGNHTRSRELTAQAAWSDARAAYFATPCPHCGQMPLDKPATPQTDAASAKSSPDSAPDHIKPLVELREAAACEYRRLDLAITRATNNYVKPAGLAELEADRENRVARVKDLKQEHQYLVWKKQAYQQRRQSNNSPQDDRIADLEAQLANYDAGLLKVCQDIDNFGKSPRTLELEASRDGLLEERAAITSQIMALDIKRQGYICRQQSKLSGNDRQTFNANADDLDCPQDAEIAQLDGEYEELTAAIEEIDEEIKEVKSNGS